MSKTKQAAQVAKIKKQTIKSLIYSMFEKTSLDEVKFNDELVKKVKQIKKDSKFDRYHLSYWKSKYRLMKRKLEQEKSNKKQTKKSK